MREAPACVSLWGAVESGARVGHAWWQQSVPPGLTSGTRLASTVQCLSSNSLCSGGGEWGRPLPQP